MPSGSVYSIPGMIAIICCSLSRQAVCTKSASPAEIIISSDWIADSEVVTCISTVCALRDRCRMPIGFNSDTTPWID